MKATGIYVALSASYYLDDKIDEAGPEAELLFVRAIAFSAQMLSDGFVTTRQLHRFVGQGLDNVDDRCERLIKVGLWRRDADRDGIQIVNFLRWNRSREEVQMHRARDAARKREARSKKPSETPSDRSPDGRPDGVQTESARSPAQQHNITTTHLKVSDRTKGPVRSETSRASRASAAPPDLSDVRKKISDSARAARARSARGGREEGVQA